MNRELLHGNRECISWFREPPTGSAAGLKRGPKTTESGLCQVYSSELHVHTHLILGNRLVGPNTQLFGVWIGPRSTRIRIGMTPKRKDLRAGWSL